MRSVTRPAAGAVETTLESAAAAYAEGDAATAIDVARHLATVTDGAR